MLNESERYNLVGFYDPDQAQVKHWRKATGYTYFESQQASHACDVIDIVTPTLYHHAVAKECIAQGKHIFIEKPITRTVEEAEELVQLARRQRR